MEKGLEDVVEGEAPKHLFVIDTNVLMLNRLAPFVLANGWEEIRDDDLGKQIMLTAEKQRRLKTHPNHVVIYDLVVKELDGIMHNPKQPRSVKGVAGQARRVLSDIADMGLVHAGEGASYVRLENGSRIYFVDHNEERFLESQRFDPNIDDRLVWNFEQMLKANRGQQYAVQLVSQDVVLKLKARTRAAGVFGKDPDQVKLTQESVGQFEFETVEDPHQTYSGSKIVELSPQEFAAFISGKDNLIQEESRPTPLKVVTLKANQFIEARSGPAREQRILKGDGKELHARKLVHYEEFMREAGKVVQGQYKSKDDIEVPHDVEMSHVRALWEKERDLTPEYVKSLKGKSDKLKGEADRAYREVAWSLYCHKSDKSKKTTGFHLPYNPLLKPKREQQYALELLCDPNITVASLVGPPGTGKTLWALYAGLVQQAQGRYKEIVYFRPPIGLNEGHGFVKGSQKQKLAIWVKPAIDSLVEIFGGYGGTRAQRKAVNDEIEWLQEEGMLVLDEADTHQQGATWRDRYVIIDESQLTTKDQMRTMVNRVGDGSKLILIGDPDQVGATSQVTHWYLNESNNGLVHAVGTLQGQPLYGHITFLEDATIMRSRTARELGKLL